MLLLYSSVMDKVNETHPPINIDIIFIEPQPVLLLLLLLLNLFLLTITMSGYTSSRVISQCLIVTHW